MTDVRELPNGWRWARFGELVRQVKRTTKDPEGEGLTRIVGLEHLDSESLPLRRWHELDDLPDGTSFTRVFRAGQVLFGKRRAYQRKVAVADFDGVCSGDILVFERSTEGLLPEFLPYVVQSDRFFDHALGTSAGSLSPRTKWQELAKFEFVLPPVDAQRSAIELLQAADRSISTDEEALAALIQLREASMVELAHKAPRRPLRDVLQLLTKGTTPTSLGMDFADEGVVFLKAENVGDGRLSFDERTYITDATHSALARSSLEAGDVLLTIAGTVGRVALVPEAILPANCNQAVAVLRPTLQGSSRFLARWLQSGDAAGQIRVGQRSNTISNLSLGKIGELEFPVLDRSATELADKQFSLLDDVYDTVALKLHQSRRLRSALRESFLSGDGTHV